MYSTHFKLMEFGEVSIQIIASLCEQRIIFYDWQAFVIS
jgi:hypothetical protein